ncbi:hypothetical protein [Pseudomonas phage LUZ7]|uniref:Uncharacterized protein n=1 Tax=Pseudomonas phage LUZ7 TaxID=655097 RepID=C8ZKH1_9CAUD|nr:hypothetical protein PP-LUZ7_gp072 [Pseudomonas phage LUZ7]CAZ66213.1 hypothetical protein [Pseudomonas phage LUZ7]
MDALKVFVGVCLFLGIIVGGAFVVYVASWVFRILGFLFAVAIVLCLIGVLFWEILANAFKKKGEH